MVKKLLIFKFYFKTSHIVRFNTLKSGHYFLVTIAIIIYKEILITFLPQLQSVFTKVFNCAHTRKHARKSITAI